MHAGFKVESHCAHYAIHLRSTLYLYAEVLHRIILDVVSQHLHPVTCINDHFARIRYRTENQIPGRETGEMR